MQGKHTSVMFLEDKSGSWGSPCIWTCNFDNDPRKNKGVAEYIQRVSRVVETRDRPAERGWGKLYELEDVEGEEEVGERLEALEEASLILYDSLGTLKSGRRGHFLQNRRSG